LTLLSREVESVEVGVMELARQVKHRILNLSQYLANELSPERVLLRMRNLIQLCRARFLNYVESKSVQYGGMDVNRSGGLNSDIRLKQERALLKMNADGELFWKHGERFVEACYAQLSSNRRDKRHLMELLREFGSLKSQYFEIQRHILTQKLKCGQVRFIY
jgi:hypothetical protein